MGKYVDSNLLTGEEVVYNANIHWFIFLPGLMMFLLVGFALFFFSGGSADTSTDGMIVLFKVFGTLIGICTGIWLLVKAAIYKISTELAVTSKRIVAKTGLIKRNTIELNHSKVESFNVDQSVMGRIFGFGTITVNGTGGVQTPIPNIDNPLAFRKQAMSTVDSQES